MKFAWMYLFQHLDTWSFNVFALNDASGDHALKFVFYELLTRYDLIQRFKVCAKLPLHSYFYQRIHHYVQDALFPNQKLVWHLRIPYIE